ncbi:hypothetical protein S245_033005 [Arachis hypogaea]
MLIYLKRQMISGALRTGTEEIIVSSTIERVAIDSERPADDVQCIKRRKLVQFEEEEDEHLEPNVVDPRGIFLFLSFSYFLFYVMKYNVGMFVEFYFCERNF